MRDVLQYLHIWGVGVVKSRGIDKVNAQGWVVHEIHVLDICCACEELSVLHWRYVFSDLQDSKPSPILTSFSVQVEMKVLFPQPVTPMTAMYMSSILARRLVNNQETFYLIPIKWKIDALTGQRLPGSGSGSVSPCSGGPCSGSPCTDCLCFEP
jgi:hypothetical protein